jgi:hypothetical protein
MPKNSAGHTLPIPHPQSLDSPTSIPHKGGCPASRVPLRFLPACGPCGAGRGRRSRGFTSSPRASWVLFGSLSTLGCVVLNWLWTGRVCQRLGNEDGFGSAFGGDWGWGSVRSIDVLVIIHPSVHRPVRGGVRVLIPGIGRSYTWLNLQRSLEMPSIF